VKTLNIWHDNFMKPEVQEFSLKKFGKPFVRMWSLYLRMASAFIATGSIDLHQFVLVKGEIPEGFPMTLEDIYTGWEEQ
jgi:cyclopropane-fatty-acyl-phospholipid synthase